MKAQKKSNVLAFISLCFCITFTSLTMAETSKDKAFQTVYQRFFHQYEKSQTRSLTMDERYSLMKKSLMQAEQVKIQSGKIPVTNRLPFMTRSNSEDQYWDNRFYISGLDAQVFSIVQDGENSLYVAGTFEYAGGIKVGGIAYFDGTNWSDLQGGTNGIVTTVVKHGSDIYIGGYFTRVGDIEANNIAKWDGQSWSNLGSGVDGGVWAIAVGTGATFSQPFIYVGGEFLHAGETETNHLAVWDGAHWQELGGGTDGPVMDIILTMNGLIIGGGFEQVGHEGGTSMNNIARWIDGEWLSLGNGVDGPVVDLEYNNDKLYVGGLFEQADGMTVNHFAVWQAGDWYRLGSGFNHDVYSITVEGDNIYVGGYFDKAGSTDVKNIAMWDDEIWADMGGGTDHKHKNAVYVLVSDTDNVFAGGEFKQMGLVNSDYLAIWENDFWRSLFQNNGKGVKDKIFALDNDNDRLVVGGKIHQTGEEMNTGISQWDGTKWLQMNQILKGDVLDVAVKGDSIIVVGTFYQDLPLEEPPHTLPLHHVALWDGEQWQALGDGLGKNSHPKAIEIIDDHIYLAGTFNLAGNAAVNNIARWNGTEWQDVNGGVKGVIHDMKAVDQTLYVVGEFDQAGNIVAKNIARFDGTSWYSFPNSDFDSGIHAIEINPYEVIDGSAISFYIGGDFTQIGSLEAKQVAKWTGFGWMALGNGLYHSPGNGCVYDLELIEQMLYAGGRFSVAGNQQANNIAMWWDGGWLPLGNGLNGTVHALSKFENALYAGGEFTMAGNKASHALARWELHNVPPIVTINSSTMSGFVPLKVEFDATGSIDPDGQIASYQWDFESNGTIDCTENFGYYTYTQPGEYTVTLTIIDNNGLSNTETLTISVISAPDIAIEHNSMSIPNGFDGFDFGTLAVDELKTLSFQIKNMGTKELELRSDPPVMINDKENHFTVESHPPSIIGTGESFTFDITFKPLSEGEHNAEIFILNNDPDETTFSFYLKGKGYADNTVYVDDSNTQGPWLGTKELPYKSIQDAVDRCTNGDSIYVFSGIYEHFEIDKYLRIQGEKAEQTIIDAKQTTNGIMLKIDNTLSTAIEQDPVIAGFTIKNAKKSSISARTLAGIRAFNPMGLNWIIRNNILYDNDFGAYLGEGNYRLYNNRLVNNASAGIFRLSPTDNNTQAMTRIVNNVIYGRSGAGIHIQGENPELYAMNNIFMQNKYGIYIEKNISLEAPKSIIIAYNDFFKNGTPANFRLGEGNLYTDPSFDDINNYGFHLRKNSPCIDAGNPSRKYLDIDGTLNDMGCYGGPFGKSYKYPSQSTNLAFNKPVTTNDGSNDGQNLVDENWKTYWRPVLPIDQLNQTKIYATVDLADERSFFPVQYFIYKIGLDYFPIIHYMEDASRYFRSGLKLIIQVSKDNRQWITVDSRYPRFERTEHIYLRKPVYARYVRLLLYFNSLPIIQKDRLRKLNYRVYELQVYTDYPKKSIQYTTPKHQDGWDMIAFPGEPYDMSRSALFPDKNITVIGWVDNQYIAVDTLCVGQGYWILNKAPNTQTYNYSVVGDREFSHTFLNEGWHIIGTGMTKVSLGNLYAQPENSVISYAYEYDIASNSYLQVEMLEPQKGYWIYVKEPCTLTSQPISEGLKKGRIHFIKSQPPAPPFQMIDDRIQTNPTEFRMSQNYPNPFNPVTRISYSLPKTQLVQVDVYNLKGEHIKTLEAKDKNAGSHQVEWDGSDKKGQSVPSGLYLIELKTDEYQMIIKAMLIK